MTGDDFTVVLAVIFTCGCITIHEMRKHAKAMTPPLALLAVSLGLFTALVAMAEQPDGSRSAAASSQNAHTKSPASRMANRVD